MEATHQLTPQELRQVADILQALDAEALAIIQVLLTEEKPLMMHLLFDRITNLFTPPHSRERVYGNVSELSSLKLLRTDRADYRDPAPSVEINLNMPPLALRLLNAIWPTLPTGGAA
jgi:hypothetical protein